MSDHICCVHAPAYKMKLSKPSKKIEILLEPFGFELLTVSLVMVWPKKLNQFAPVGLVNMVRI